jgi:hypothetical protein
MSAGKLVTGSIVAVAALSAVVPAVATACDPAMAGQQVSHGTSVGGVRWSQRASVGHGRLTVFLNIAKPYGDWGGGQSGPVPRRGLIYVDYAEDMGQDGSEVIVAGSASRETRRVEVTFADGHTVSMPAHRAPPRAVRRAPKLRQVRFYGAVVSPSATPTLVQGYDAAGKVVAMWPGRPSASARPVARAACMP